MVKRIILLVAALDILTGSIACSQTMNREGARKPGLVGAWFGEADLTDLQEVDLLMRLERVWAEQDDRGREWSAKWQGFVAAPVSGEITFHAETSKSLVVEINGREIINITGAQGRQSGSFSMVKGKEYPIEVAYFHVGGFDGYLRVKWSWAGEGKMSIPGGNLRHTVRQLQAMEAEAARPPKEEPGSMPRLSVPVRNVIVYGEPGRFGGWPANNGVWSWGNEILVGFHLGYYKASRGGHSIDRNKPQESVLARSLDGGESWKVEDPDNFVGDGGKAVPCPGNINFAHPDFAMRCGGDEFYISYDRGKSWQGPYQFPDFGTDRLTSRTDYIVNGRDDCVFFLSAKEEKVRAGLQDRGFCALTADGGKTINFVSWMTHEPITVRSVMPSTVRISENQLVSAMRRRHDVPVSGRSKINNNWIDVYVSNDNGGTWQFLSKVADTDTGKRNGNPPSTVRLKDGRLCVTYGYRAAPCGIRAKLSSDNGKTWGEEIGLRVDGRTWDLGYTRTVQRLDGKLVTIYYYTTNENPEQHIAATIWDPDLVGKRNVEK